MFYLIVSLQNKKITINKYKKVEYIAEEYPTPLEIMTDLNELEMQITAGLSELEEML